MSELLTPSYQIGDSWLQIADLMGEVFCGVLLATHLGQLMDNREQTVELFAGRVLRGEQRAQVLLGSVHDWGDQRFEEAVEQTGLFLVLLEDIADSVFDLG